MENSLTHECPIYPGQYAPLFDREASKTGHVKNVNEPLINIDELDKCFKIDVVIPGTRKEDIMINLHDNILCVTVLHDNLISAERKIRIHEFDTNYFERHIRLPPNADAQLMFAEYKEGILNLHIPKTEQPAENYAAHIAVY